MSATTLAARTTRLVVRRAWWAYLPLLIFLAAGCAFWAALAWQAAGVPIVRSVLVLLAAFMLTLFLLVASRTLRLFGEANWVLRVIGDALILNPIDALGRTYGEPIELPFAEIASARRIVEKRVAVGDHTVEDVHETHVYLELGLGDVDCTPLVGLRPPLTLASRYTLRIGWRDRATRLTPSLATFLDALPATVARESDARLAWQESRTLSDEEFRERVRALCAGNDKLGAIKVVRVRYNMDLREAQEFVEHVSAS